MESNLIYPPYNFGFVDDGIYRSGVPTNINFSYLKSLNLNTMIYLGEQLDEDMESFFKKSNIKLVILPSTNSITEETVVTALSIIVNIENLPVLISCQTGKNLTGSVVGCYRKIKKWSLVSIFEEYRRFVGYTSSFSQQQHEQFIELFDNDLVIIPPQLNMHNLSI